MARTKKTIEELLNEGFEGSRGSGSFKDFTNEEFVGYVTGVTKLNNIGCNYSVAEIHEVARVLFNDCLSSE